MLNPVFWKKYFKMLSAEILPRMLSIEKKKKVCSHIKMVGIELMNIILSKSS